MMTYHHWLWWLWWLWWLIIIDYDDYDDLSSLTMMTMMTYHHWLWWLWWHIIIDYDDLSSLTMMTMMTYPATTLLFFHYLTTDILYGVTRIIPTRILSHWITLPTRILSHWSHQQITVETIYRHRRKLHRILTIQSLILNCLKLIIYITQDAEMILYTSKPKTSWGKHCTSCFTRLVKSCTTIWTIILDPLNS
jgi:hypothetical protein